MIRPSLAPGATSVLFAPGHELSTLSEAGSAYADLLVLDLEDTVPTASKALARDSVRQTIAKMSTAECMTTFLRPNLEPDGYLLVELEMARSLAGIVVPKASSAEDVRTAIAALEQANGKSSVSLIVTVETARGVLHAEEIVAADERVIGVIFGPSDLTLELGVLGTATHDELAYPRAHVSLCAAAAGVVAIDGGFALKDDQEGLASDTIAARNLGYRCKLTTFPSHVSVINRLMRTTEAEVAWATEILSRPAADAVSLAKARLVLDRWKPTTPDTSREV